MNRLFFLLLILAMLPICPGVAEEIEVLSYNVFLRPSFVGWFDYRDERFAELVDAVRPYDIVGLCEVFEDELRDEWMQRIYDTHPYQIEPPKSKNPFFVNGGITLFSRHPVTLTRKMIYRIGGNWDFFSEKGVIFARIQVTPQKMVEVALTHAQAGSDYAEIRRQQLIMMQEFVERHHLTGCPLLLLGDFNVNSEKPEYQQMLDIFSRPMDVYPFLKKDPGYTINGLENPLVGGSGLKRLDYILLRDDNREVLPLECAVNKFPMANPVGKAQFMSDHYAVEATLSLGERRIQRRKINVTIALQTAQPTRNEQRGKILLRDARGKSEQYDFVLAAGAINNQISIPAVLPGRYVLHLYIAGRTVRKIVDINDDELLPIALPFGEGHCHYHVPRKWQGQSMSLQFNGPCSFTQQLKAGDVVEFSRLPQGQYRIALRLGNHVVTRELSLQQKNVNLAGILDVDDLTLLTGSVPVGFTGEIFFVPASSTTPGKRIRAHLVGDRYSVAVEAGNYYLWLQTPTVDWLSPIRIAKAEQRHDLIFDENAMRIEISPGNVAMLACFPEEIHVPSMLQREQIIAGQFALFPLRRPLHCQGFSSTKFCIYTEQKGQWRLLEELAKPME